MNDLLLIALTPLIVLLILALFRFTACKPFDKAEAPATPTVPPPPPPIPPAPTTYAELVASTKGFAAHWPLDETGGNQVKMLGPLSTLCQYEPTGTVGRKLGEPGAFKSGLSRAPEFDGSVAYVEVPFIPLLNTSDFSVELWVKPNPDLGKDTQVLISSHHFGDERGYEILLIRSKNQPNQHQLLKGRVFSSSAAALSEVAIQLTPQDGDPKEWRCVLMTYQGIPSGVGTLTLHVRLAKAPNWFVKPTLPNVVYAIVNSASPATLRFGSSHTAGQKAGNFFAGQIDEVALYNAVLPDGDRDAHYNMAMS